MASIMRFCRAAYLVAAVTGHAQICVYQHGVPRLKTEVGVQRACQSAHGNEGRGDQYGADCNLNHKQNVADGQPPTEPCA